MKKKANEPAEELLNYLLELTDNPSDDRKKVLEEKVQDIICPPEVRYEMALRRAFAPGHWRKLSVEIVPKR